MRKRSKSIYSQSERIRIVKEYEASSQTASEVGQKYGISGNLLSKWRTRLHDSRKDATFAPVHVSHQMEETPMKEKTREELEAEIKALRKELEWSRLQTKALNTMIDIAEEQGIRIRKKSGAKQ